MHVKILAKSRCRPGLCSRIGAAACAVAISALVAVPVLAEDPGVLLERIERMEREVDRLEALEKRIDDLCGQLEELTDRMTAYSARQSADSGKGVTEDEAYWREYWERRVEECQ